MTFANVWLIVGFFATLIVIFIQYNSKMTINALTEDKRRKEIEKEYEERKSNLLKDLQGFDSVDKEIKYRKIDTKYIDDAEIVE